MQRFNYSRALDMNNAIIIPEMIVLKYFNMKSSSEIKSSSEMNSSEMKISSEMKSSSEKVLNRYHKFLVVEFFLRV